MSLEHTARTLQLAVGASEHDPTQVQWTRLAQASDEREFCAAWLALQCAMLPGALRAVVVLGPPEVGPFAPVAFWPESLTAGTPALAAAAERALSEREGVLLRHGEAPADGPALHHDAVAWPVQLQGHLYGLVAVEFARGHERQLQATMRGLQWGAAGLEALLARRELRHEEATRERLIGVLDLTAAMLEQEAFDAAARALVNQMAVRFDCDRVSFGITDAGRTRVEALSQAAEFATRMNLMNAVAGAMDEACDQHASIVFPEPRQAPPQVTRAHAELARLHGAGASLTVPFATGAGFAGAVTLERPAQRPFEAAEVELVESLMAVVAPMLEARRQGGRGIAKHAWDDLARGMRALFGPRHIAWKLVVVALIAAGFFFGTATGEFRVTAPARLEGEVRRVIVAPFDGYIGSAPARAGQVLKKGATLATLDTRELLLDRLKWSSQANQFSRQYEEATAAHERAKAMMAQAQQAQALAQLRLVEEQLARAVLAAPFDGIVTSGDLSQQLGSGVRRGQTLFEIAPLASYRLVVEVDEGDISYVQPGQKGRVVLAAVTEQPFGFTVHTVTPVTTAREGRNAFRVEALLDAGSARLRPGMEGVAKISVDERRLAWVWTHKLIDWLRLTFWTWWP